MRLKNKGIQQILNNKVVKAGSWYTFTNFFTKGVAFLTIPIFTRLLTPADYGVTSLYASWLSILTIIISLDLNASIGRGKFDFKEDYDGFMHLLNEKWFFPSTINIISVG